MKRNRQFIQKFKDQRGVTAIVVAVMITVLMGFVGFAVDIGYVAATRNQLQNTADAAALAGAGLLGQIYLNMSSIDQQNYDCSTEQIWVSGVYDEDSIVAQALDVAGSGLGKNRAGVDTTGSTGVDIEILSGDVFIGVWDGTNPITETDCGNEEVDSPSPDAVTVTVRRDNAANGPITTFFAKLLGWKTASLKADATAALTGLAEAAPGTLNLPIGLSIWQFYYDCDFEKPKSGVCSDEITFSPTTDSCAGWHNFKDKIDGDAEEEKLLGFIEGNVCGEACSEPAFLTHSVESAFTDGAAWLSNKFTIDLDDIYGTEVGTQTPETVVGKDVFFFQGGKIAKLLVSGGVLTWDDSPAPRIIPSMDNSTIPSTHIVDGNSDKPTSFFALFDYFRFRDGDGDNSVWTAAAPVYEDECGCDNPKDQKILGFANVVVRVPNPPPDNTVTATVDCNFTVIEGRGGGGNYGGLKGSIPNLVE